MPRAAAAALLLALAAPSAVASADWETTRRTVIDPLNSALHRHLPSFLKARDLDALLGLYATDIGTGVAWDHPVAVYGGQEEETLEWRETAGSETIRERYAR